MASSASAPSPNPPLSLTDEEDGGQEERNRKRKVDRNSSSSPQVETEETGPSRRKIKSSRNRTLPESRISNFSLELGTSSSEENEKEVRRRKNKRSISRLRKTNRITTTPVTDVGSIKSHPPPISISPLEDNSSFQSFHPGQTTYLSTKVRDSSPPSLHLQWKEQEAEMSSEILNFFQMGTFVDVTLICDRTGEDEPMTEIAIRAHKLILASYSDYFRQILEESPCKHTVILLNGFTKRELELILEFMYRGELNLSGREVEGLLRAADALQILGIRECLEREWSGRRREMGEAEVEAVATAVRPHALPTSRNCHNNEDVEDDIGGRDLPGLLNLSMSRGFKEGGPSSFESEERSVLSRAGPQTAGAHRPGFGPHQQNHHPLHQQPNSASSPPFPRRKQARPRRRSGDFVAQDLRMSPISPPIQPPPPSNMNPIHFPTLVQEERNRDRGENEEGVLDFTINHHRLHLNSNQSERMDEIFDGVGQGVSNLIKNWPLAGLGLETITPPPFLKDTSSPVKREVESPSERGTYHSPSVTPSGEVKSERPRRGRRSMVPPYHGNGNGLLFKSSPPSSPFVMNFSSNGHQQSDSESNNPENCSTPPSGFPPPGYPPPSGTKKGSGESSGQQWPGLGLGHAPIFGRHRAQHSAPRGGPPRAWSNADLTEALHNVWNKKMTTSQASRIFGIPYNSLLMYVRGKYGKSLKLDLLKKGLDLAMENNAAAAKALSKVKGQGGSGRRSPSPNGSSPSPNNPTPPHNNNNNNNNTINSKSKGRSGPSPNLHLNTILSQGLGQGAGSPEPIRMSRHASPDSKPPMADMIPPGFNPFSMGAIFGDYPPPFGFPSVAAANAALSHILPPHHPHDLLTNSHRRLHPNGPTDKRTLK